MTLAFPPLPEIVELVNVVLDTCPTVRFPAKLFSGGISNEYVNSSQNTREGYLYSGFKSACKLNELTSTFGQAILDARAG